MEYNSVSFIYLNKQLFVSAPHKGFALVLEAQNGKITFESEQGKGTTFTIRLPITD